MSEFITGSFRNAAVPHEPMHGPILSGLMASVHPLGTRRPAAGHNRSPSESISRTEETISGECASTLSHKSCKVSASAAPPEINSKVRLSADKSVSRWASLEAWPASFSFGPLEADGAGSRLEDDAGALSAIIAPPKERAHVIHDGWARFWEDPTRNSQKDDHLAVDAPDRGERLAARRGRENHCGPAKCDQFLRWILRLAVEVAPRPERPGQQFLIRPSGDRDSLETHLHGELYTQVAEPADAQHGDQIPGQVLAMRIQNIRSTVRSRGRLAARSRLRHRDERSPTCLHHGGSRAEYGWLGRCVALGDRERRRVCGPDASGHPCIFVTFASGSF